jgi:hypothetical protein
MEKLQDLKRLIVFRFLMNRVVSSKFGAGTEQLMEADTVMAIGQTRTCHGLRRMMPSK